MSYHIRARRKMLAEGTNGSIPKMLFEELCDFLVQFLSLPIDGSRDQAEGSKKLLKYIAQAPSLDQLPEKYRAHVTNRRVLYGIRRRKSGAAEKYKNRVFVCKFCGWAYSNKYAPKVNEHSKECPSMFIFNNWQPQKLEALKFMKS